MLNETTAATRTAMENAIVFCTEKAHLNDREAVLEARQRGDCSVCEYLRYGLAKGVASYLGSIDKRAKAIYIYEDLESSVTWDSRSPNQPNLSPGIRMIVWVSRKSPALSAVVDSIASAVEEESRQLPCPKANALCHLLDVIVVDDDEVQKRIGYGALITSPYLSPIEIWHK